MLSLHGLWMEGARKQSLHKPQTPTSNKKIPQRPLEDKTINLARPPALKFHFGFCHMMLPLTSQEPQTKPPSPLCLSCFLKFYPLYIHFSLHHFHSQGNQTFTSLPFFEFNFQFCSFSSFFLIFNFNPPPISTPENKRKLGEKLTPLINYGIF